MWPLDHEMVPYHRKATAEERRAVLRNQPANVLPLLRTDDPVLRGTTADPRAPSAAQYLGLRTGDVVHIQRPDGTVYYRLTV